MRKSPINSKTIQDKLFLLSSEQISRNKLKYKFWPERLDYWKQSAEMTFGRSAEDRINRSLSLDKTGDFSSFRFSAEWPRINLA